MRELLIALITVAIFSQCTSKQEIAQWRGPDRNGIYPEKNLLTQWPDSGPKLLWKYDELGSGYASAAVTSNRVYTVGAIDSINYIFTFDTGGKLLWKKKLGPEWMSQWPGMRSSPVIYKGLGYALSGLGVLYCFNAENGDIIWQKDIKKEYNGLCVEGFFCENLVIDGDKLFCTPAGADAYVVALNRKTGDLIWKTKGTNDSTAFASPILIELGGKKFFVNQTKKFLFSVNAETGELAWKYKLNDFPMPGTPFFRNGYLYAVDSWKSGGLMLKLSDDGSSVKEVWRSAAIASQQGDMVVLGDRMYGNGSKGRKFACCDFSTGNEIFSDSTKAWINNIVSAENLLYCYDIKGEFKLLRPTEKGFDKVGSFKVKGGTGYHCSHPVIKDGRLYVRHDNSLFVYDIAK